MSTDLEKKLNQQLFKQEGEELLFCSTFMDGKEDRDDDKQRIICITMKKQKCKILKVKTSNFTSFTITKNWKMDEVSSLGVGDLETQLNITLAGSKAYTWTFDNLRKRVEFLHAIVKAYGNDEKKMPRFINFDGEMVIDQMNAINAQQASPKKDAAENDDDIQEVGEEANEVDEAIHHETELPIVDLDVILNDFNWSASADAAALEASLISELQALEAANVHDIIQSEKQANSVLHHITKAAEELDQISSWLNNYTSLLEKMGNDVHQIEAQNKGMQVTTTNQKTLLSELDIFIQSLRVPSFILEILANEGLDTADGVRECESAVEKVMKVIRYKNDELSDMTAVKERVSFLQGHANSFSTRLCKHLEVFFGQQAEFYLNDKNRASQRNALKLFAHETSESKLYKFKNLLRWLKDVDARKHYDLQEGYAKEMSRLYKREMGDFLDILKSLHMPKKPEEVDFLFTSNYQSSASTVLKTAIGVGEKSGGLFTFKRKAKKPEYSSHTSSMMGKDDDDDDNDSSSIMDNINDERMNPDEALGHALLKLTTIMVREQNFITDFFNLVKNQQSAVIKSNNDLTAPDEEEGLEKWQENLAIPRQPYKESKAEKRILELMDHIFEDIREMLLSVVEAGLKFEQSNSVGMMVKIEYHSKEYHKTCHAYVLNLLDALLKKVLVTFDKFIDSQIKAIEDTRITTKKRSGILSFVRTFPRFVDRVEKMLSAWDGNCRKLIDKSYAKIVKSMFETLESEAQNEQDSKGADEKDSLNKHIMIIENMHHFHSEIRARKVPSLDLAIKQAKIMYDSNLESYGKAVIRKPLGKLLEFFEGVEGLLKTGPADEVSYHIQYSKSALKDVIKKYPGKEIKKSLEVLYKRVDKHFTEEEGLLQVVWRSIQEEFFRQSRKYEELITKCYPDITMRLDFTVEELLGYFSELAQAH